MGWAARPQRVFLVVRSSVVTAQRKSDAHVVATGLFALATSSAALQTAWDEVSRRVDEDGEPSESIRRFSAEAPAHLDELADELARRVYRPGVTFEVPIPKKDGTLRVLQVPSVRDRVIERAVLNVVVPYVDPWLGSASFAYRPGIGVVDAVAAVARLRDEGMAWVLRADIEDCFPRLPRNVALRMLSSVLPDDSLDEIVTALVNRPVMTDHGLRELIGVAQGSSLSPVLANLVLTRLDNALLDVGFAVVRYSDDFTVVCRSREGAWEAARISSAVLEGIGMELAEDKSAVMSFEEGFCFLGEDFGPRYPPALEESRVHEPTRRVLYVGLQGSRVSPPRAGWSWNPRTTLSCSRFPPHMFSVWCASARWASRPECGIGPWPPTLMSCSFLTAEPISANSSRRTPRHESDGCARSLPAPMILASHSVSPAPLSNRRSVTRSR